MEENNNLVCDLYGLRAGLSLLSQKKDEVQSLEEGFAEYERLTKTAHEEITALQNEINQLRKERKETESKYNYYLKNRKKEINDFSTFRHVYWGNYWDSPDWIIDSSGTVSVPLMIIVYIVKALGSPFALLVFLLKLPGEKKENIQFVDNKITELKNKIAELDKNMASKENLLKTSKEHLAKSELKGASVIVEAKERLTAILAECDSTYQVLRKQYAPVIEEEDWEGLDLILWYLSSGRADDKKEALQLYDKQKQTDQIVSAIHSASNVICGTIQRGTQLLGTAMVQCFSILSDQITLQHNQTMAAIGNLDNKITATNKQINLVMSNQVLENALIEKRNASSAELVNDVKILRQKTEELYNRY